MSASRAKPCRAIDGVLLLDKPKGVTSNSVLQKMKRLYRASKAGHTGTLDPLAEGLLPICFGEATKFARFSLDAEKTYVATIRLGVRTSTGDAEGTVLQVSPVAITKMDLETALDRFRGEIAQVPPRHAALKYQGRPYYEYARAGIDIAREPRSVAIHDLVLRHFDTPELQIEARVSKGTYIRALAEDIGASLGCGAHLSALRREGVGRFVLNDAHRPVELEQLDEAARDAVLRPVEILLDQYPISELAVAETDRFRWGQAIPLLQGAPLGYVRVIAAANRQLIGLGQVDQSGVLRPVRLIRQDGVA